MISQGRDRDHDKPARRTARGCALGIVALLSASPAVAQAPDFLRGPIIPSYSRWDGGYFGVTLSDSYTKSNFGNSARDSVNFILANTVFLTEGGAADWLTATPDTKHIAGYGGFVGYNFQIAPDLVVGVEGTYTKFNSNRMQSAGTVSRSFVEANTTFRADATISSDSSITMNDYATFRGRAGYVMGQFLPYAFIGAGLFRGSSTNYVSVFATETEIANPGNVLSLNPNPTIQATSENFMKWGGVVGLGLEATLLPNLFLRGEYEYAAFAVGGTRIDMHTGRVGLGLKF